VGEYQICRGNDPEGVLARDGIKRTLEMLAYELVVGLDGTKRKGARQKS
jgi:hypothetical protein